MPAPLPTDAELAKIKLLTIDVDGVQTDGGLYYSSGGTRSVRFHVLDGQGIKRVQRAGVVTCFITQSTSEYISNRARDLGIDHCYTGIEDKSQTVRSLCDDLGIALEEVCHIADDINDISLLEIIGFPVTVPNGVPPVKAICRYETRTPGGQGAVRELCEAIIAAKGATP